MVLVQEKKGKGPHTPKTRVQSGKMRYTGFILSLGIMQ